MSEVLVKFFDALLHQGCVDIIREKGWSEESEVNFENFLYFTFLFLLFPSRFPKKKSLFYFTYFTSSLVNHINRLLSEVE
jgi:hypothetical protein